MQFPLYITKRTVYTVCRCGSSFFKPIYTNSTHKHPVFLCVMGLPCDFVCVRFEIRFWVQLVQPIPIAAFTAAKTTEEQRLGPLISALYCSADNTSQFSE